MLGGETCALLGKSSDPDAPITEKTIKMHIAENFEFWFGQTLSQHYGTSQILLWNAGRRKFDSELEEELSRVRD